MNKLDYLKGRMEKRHLSGDDFEIIGSLIYTLSSQEVCDFFDFSFQHDYHIRRYVLRKISNDISKGFLPEHKLLLSLLIKKLDQKGFEKKQSCAYSIDFIYDSLPVKEKRKILLKFLFSTSSRNRDRALKRIKSNWNGKYQQLIEKVWNLYKDQYALDIIISFFPPEYLLNNYKTLIPHANSYQISKLFIKLGQVDLQKVEELKIIDEISFAYVMTKFERKISISDAKDIIKRNYQDERIGLLMWCFGQMGLWEGIIDYDINYLNKHRLATIDKFVHQ